MDGPSRTFTTQLYSNASNTPSQCALACRAAGYKYSGTEYSSECWCSNRMAESAAPQTDCSMPCTGDTAQICGAGYRLSVAQDVSSTATFSARQSYGSWTLMACYVDSVSNRTLPNIVSTPGSAGNMTEANCLDACTAAGWKACGVEYYHECFASSAVPDPSLVAAPAADPLSAGCAYACAGNTSEACGGSNRVLVYVNNGS